MAASKPWTRVIVLTPAPPRGRGLSDPLKSIFAARDWFAIEQHDPHQAMAELCLRERTQVSRAAWGLQRMEQIALVIHDVSCWSDPHTNDLVAAVRRYVPAASVWYADDREVYQVHEGAAPQLSDANSNPLEFDGAAPMRVAATIAPRQPSAPPNLRLAGEGELKSASAPIEGGDDTESAGDEAKDARLTRAEIEMLLDAPSSPPSARHGVVR